MKKIPIKLLKRHADIGFGEIITEINGSLVKTTAQLAQGQSEAATFAYIIDRRTDLHVHLKKHPNIKGRPGR